MIAPWRAFVIAEYPLSFIQRSIYNCEYVIVFSRGITNLDIIFTTFQTTTNSRSSTCSSTGIFNSFNSNNQWMSTILNLQVWVRSWPEHLLPRGSPLPGNDDHVRVWTADFNNYRVILTLAVPPLKEHPVVAILCYLRFFRLLIWVQVEYAIEAIKLGSTAIGIQTSEGVSWQEIVVDRRAS